MSKLRNETEVYSRDIGFCLRISYNSDGRQEYVGRAYPNPAGTSDSAAIWSIYRLTYDGSGRMTHRFYADGTDDHIKKWSLKSTYTYA